MTISLTAVLLPPREDKNSGRTLSHGSTKSSFPEGMIQRFVNELLAVLTYLLVQSSKTIFCMIVKHKRDGNL